MMTKPTGGIYFPVGMDLKFGTGGITMGKPGSSGGGNAANGGVANIYMMRMANNHAAALALARGGLGVPSNTNATICIAVANIQYSTNPAYGLHHQQQHHQHLGSGMNKGMADKQRLQNQDHAKQLRVLKKFMLKSLQTGAQAPGQEFHVVHAGAAAHPTGGDDDNQQMLFQERAVWRQEQIRGQQ